MKVAPHITLPSIRLLNEASDPLNLAVSENIIGSKISDFKAASSLERLFDGIDNKRVSGLERSNQSNFSAIGAATNLETLFKETKTKSRARKRIHIFDVNDSKKTGNEKNTLKDMAISFLEKFIDMLER